MKREDQLVSLVYLVCVVWLYATNQMNKTDQITRSTLAHPTNLGQFSCRSSLVVPHLRTIEVLACYNGFPTAC